jgi:hypothetical protein
MIKWGMTKRSFLGMKKVFWGFSVIYGQEHQKFQRLKINNGLISTQKDIDQKSWQA